MIKNNFYFLFLLSSVVFAQNDFCFATPEEAEIKRLSWLAECTSLNGSGIGYVYLPGNHNYGSTYCAGVVCSGCDAFYNGSVKPYCCVQQKEPKPYPAFGCNNLPPSQPGYFESTPSANTNFSDFCTDIPQTCGDDGGDGSSDSGGGDGPDCSDPYEIEHNPACDVADFCDRAENVNHPDCFCRDHPNDPSCGIVEPPPDTTTGPPPDTTINPPPVFSVGVIDSLCAIVSSAGYSVRVSTSIGVGGRSASQIKSEYFGSGSVWACNKFTRIYLSSGCSQTFVPDRVFYYSFGPSPNSNSSYDCVNCSILCPVNSSNSSDSSDNSSGSSDDGSSSSSEPYWCDLHPDDAICDVADYDEYCEQHPNDPFCVHSRDCSLNPSLPECVGPRPPKPPEGGGGDGPGGGEGGDGGGSSDSSGNDSLNISCESLSNCDWAKLSTQLLELGVSERTLDSLSRLLSVVRSYVFVDSVRAVASLQFLSSIADMEAAIGEHILYGVIPQLNILASYVGGVTSAVNSVGASVASLENSMAGWLWNINDNISYSRFLVLNGLGNIEGVLRDVFFSPWGENILDNVRFGIYEVGNMLDYDIYLFRQDFNGRWNSWLSQFNDMFFGWQGQFGDYQGAFGDYVDWLKGKSREDSLLSLMRWNAEADGRGRLIEVGETISGRIYSYYASQSDISNRQLAALDRMDSANGLYYASVSDGLSGISEGLGRLDSSLSAGNADILGYLDSLSGSCQGDNCGDYSGAGEGAFDGLDTSGLSAGVFDSLLTAPGSKGLSDSVSVLSGKIRQATATPFFDNMACPAADLSIDACVPFGSSCAVSLCDDTFYVKGRHVFEWVGVFVEFVAWVLFLVRIA